jgi:hypothetical protein
MDHVTIGRLLLGVVDRDPARALGGGSLSDMRKRQAVFHPDKGGDVELSQLANACADVINRKSWGLLDAHTELAKKHLANWHVVQNKINDQRRREVLREIRFNDVAALLPKVKLILDGLERVPGKDASKAVDVRNLLRKRLGLTREEACRLLAELGVKCYTTHGRTILSLNSRCLRLPVNHCCACGRPMPDDVLEVLEGVVFVEASTISEVHAFVRRVCGVSLSEARRLAQEAGVVSKQYRGEYDIRDERYLRSRAAFRDGSYVRVPPNTCVACGRASAGATP